MSSKVRRYRVIEERGPILVLEEQNYVAPSPGVNLQNNGVPLGVMDTLNIEPDTEPLAGYNRLAWVISTAGATAGIAPLLQEWKFNGQFNPIRVSGGPSTAPTNASFIIGKTSVGPVTFNLPAISASPTGKFYIFKDEGNAAVNNITINAHAGDAIDGAASIVINTNYGIVRLAWWSFGALSTWYTW